MQQREASLLHSVYPEARAIMLYHCIPMKRRAILVYHLLSPSMSLVTRKNIEIVVVPPFWGKQESNITRLFLRVSEITRGYRQSKPQWVGQAVEKRVCVMESALTPTTSAENITANFDDTTTAPTVLDLFSGAGGTGLGFVKAGFRIVGAVEIDPYAAETYTFNLKVKVTQKDIRDINPEQFRQELGLKVGQLDVLVGCPPCQGFSRMRRQGENDTRNELVLHYLRFLETFMPGFAVFENVPGIRNTKHGRAYLAQLLSGFRRLGYQAIQRVVDVADYGVPQHRKRVVIILKQGNERPSFPSPTHGNPKKKQSTLPPWVTVRKAISHYPALQAGEESTFANHKAPMIISDSVRDFISRVPKDGGSRRQVPRQYWLECHKRSQGHNDVYGRIAWEKPANTITGGCINLSKGRFVHPEQDRCISAREAARLQGFPDNFIFKGSNLGLQIGNAVPPPLALQIAMKLQELMGYPVAACPSDNELEPGIVHIADGLDDKLLDRNPAALPNEGLAHLVTKEEAAPTTPSSLSLD